ncbi:hypothetical protein FSP39_009034 [Pinctada imbricata]|uniref:Uncharacterized protein n=1 Tax=Pinctada imbricata TaxID=66713 RepID=A0AA88XZU3_PINIB|nr:hypothetical protein FSP39_009034 [Pinctada imbricata]
MGVDFLPTGIDFPPTGIDFPPTGIDFPTPGIDFPLTDFPLTGIDILISLLYTHVQPCKMNEEKRMQEDCATDSQNKGKCDKMREPRGSQNSASDESRAVASDVTKSRDGVSGVDPRAVNTTEGVQLQDTAMSHHTGTSKPPANSTMAPNTGNMSVNAHLNPVNGNQSTTDAAGNLIHSMAKEAQDNTVRRIDDSPSSGLPSLVPVTRTLVPTFDTRTLSPLSVSNATYTPLTSPSNTRDLSNASASNLHMVGNSQKTSSVPYHGVSGGLPNSSSVYQSMQSLNDRYLSPMVSLPSRVPAAGTSGAPGVLALPGFHTLARTSSLPNVPGQTSSPGGIPYSNMYQMMRHSSMLAVSPGLTSTPISQSPVGRSYPYTGETVPLNMSTTSKNLTDVTQSTSAPSVNLFPSSSSINQGTPSSMMAGVGVPSHNNVGVPYNSNMSYYRSPSHANLQTGHNVNMYGSVQNVNLTAGANTTQGGVSNLPTWTNMSDTRGNPRFNMPSGGIVSNQRVGPNMNMPMSTQGSLSNVNMYSGNVSVTGGVRNNSAPNSTNVSTQGAVNANMSYGSDRHQTHGNVHNVNMTGDNVPHPGRSNLPSGGLPQMSFPLRQALKSRLSAVEGNVERLVLANKLNGNSQDPLVLDANDLLSNLKVDTVESLHQLLEKFSDSERNLSGAMHHMANHVPSSSIQSSGQVSASGHTFSTDTTSTGQKQPYLSGDDLIRAAADLSQIPTNLSESDMQSIPHLSGGGNGYELDVNLTIVHDGNKEEPAADLERKVLTLNNKQPRRLMTRSQVNALHKSVSLYWPDFTGYPTSCICDPGIGKEIAVEQIWMHEKQLYFMPQIEIITIGSQELVGIIKSDNVYVSVGQIFLHLLPEMRKEIENYLVTKECDRAFLSLEEMAYLQQRKCININSATIISLASLRAMCTSLLEGKSFVDSPTINLYEAANCTYYRKILSNHTKCSNCGGSMKDETIPDDYEEFDSPELPVSNNAMKEAYQNLLTKRMEERKKNLDNVVQKDGENLMKEIKVGTATVGHVHFNVFVMDGKMYISIRELILSKVMTIQGLQNRLVELKYKPRPAPSTVDLYFISENIDVDNTLWVDLETLRCVCCIKVATPKGWNMEVYHRLKLKQYSFQEDATFRGEDDCAWEGVVYTLNTHTFKIATTKRLTSKIVELPPKSFKDKEKNIPKRVRSKYGKERKEGHVNKVPEGQKVNDLLKAAGGSRRKQQMKTRDVKAVRSKSEDPVYMSVADVLKPGYYVFKDKESIQRFLNTTSPTSKEIASKTKQSMLSKDVVQILDFGSQSSDSSPIILTTNSVKMEIGGNMAKKKRGRPKGIPARRTSKKYECSTVQAEPNMNSSTKQDDKSLPEVDITANTNVSENFEPVNDVDASPKITKDTYTSKLVGIEEKQQNLPKLTITLSKVSEKEITMKNNSMEETKGHDEVAVTDDPHSLVMNSKENRSNERSKGKENDGLRQRISERNKEKENDVLNLSTKSSSPFTSFEQDSSSKKRKRERSSEGKSKRKHRSNNELKEGEASIIEQEREAEEPEYALEYISSPSLESDGNKDLINMTLHKEKIVSPERKKCGPKLKKNKTVEKEKLLMSEMNEEVVTMEGTVPAAEAYRTNECFSPVLNSEVSITDIGEPMNISKEDNVLKEVKSPKGKKKNNVKKSKKGEESNSSNLSIDSDSCQKQVSVPVESEKSALVERSEILNDLSVVCTETNVRYDVKETENAASLLDQYMQNEENSPVQDSPSYSFDVPQNENSYSQEVGEPVVGNSDNTQLEETNQIERNWPDEEVPPTPVIEVTKPQAPEVQTHSPTILQTVEINDGINDVKKSTQTESRTESTKNKKSDEKDVKKKGKKKGEKMRLLSSKPKKSERKEQHVENETETVPLGFEKGNSAEVSFGSSEQCDISMTDARLVNENSEQEATIRNSELVSPERSVIPEERMVQTENSVHDDGTKTSFVSDSKTCTDEGECDVDIDYYEKHPMETKDVLKKMFGILDACVDFNGNFMNGFDVSNFHLKPGADEHFPCLTGEDFERRNHLLDSIYEAFRNVCDLPAVSKELHQIDADDSNFVGDKTDDVCDSTEMDPNTDSHKDDAYTDIEGDFTSPPMSQDYMNSLGLIESSKLHLLSPPRRLRSSHSEMQMKLLEMEAASKKDIKEQVKKIKGNKINKLTSLKSKHFKTTLKGYHASAHRRLQDAILAKSGKLVKCTQGLKELKNLCIEMNEGSGKLRSGVFKRSPKQGNKSNKNKRSRKKEKSKSGSERSRSLSPQKKEKERNNRSRSLEKLGSSKKSEKANRKCTKTLRQSRSLDSLKRKTSVKSLTVISKVENETTDRNSRVREAKTKAESAIRKVQTKLESAIKETSLKSCTVNAGSEKVLASKVKKDFTSVGDEFGLKRAYVTLERESVNKTVKKDAVKLKSIESSKNRDKTAKLGCDAEILGSSEGHDKVDKLNSRLGKTKPKKDSEKHEKHSLNSESNKTLEKLGRNAARISQCKSAGKLGSLQRSPLGYKKLDASRLATEVITAREAKRRKRLMLKQT